MRRDLCNALLQRHPRIFANPEGRGDAAGDLETRVGDGWYTLLDVLCTDLQYETDQEDVPQVHATQIKEKFGRLRFRVDQASDRQRAMIRLAESLSERTCEECGAPAGLFTVATKAPRCRRHRKGRHFPISHCRLSRMWMLLWARLQPRPATLEVLEAAWRLNEAIRENDLEAAKEALNAGALLNACTLDHEAYHTPYELAQRHGRTELVRLLDKEVEAARLPRR